MTDSGIQRIVAFGDSITEGTYGGAEYGETWTFLLEQMLRKKSLDFQILNSGIPGETTPQGQQRFNESVVYHKPKFVLIMYGANDSFLPFGYGQAAVPIQGFKQAVAGMITLSIENQIVPVIMTTTPFSQRMLASADNHDQNKLLDTYMDVLRELANESDLPLIDHFRHWILLEKHGVSLEDFLPDGVHPNAEGNRVFAKTTFEKLYAIIGDNK